MTATEVSAYGKPLARVILYLMAESAMKCTGNRQVSEDSSSDISNLLEQTASGLRRSPYRDAYDFARLVYSERDWTPAHQHNAALRKVAKEIIKDMWIVCDVAEREGIPGAATKTRSPRKRQKSQSGNQMRDQTIKRVRVRRGADPQSSEMEFI
jgi:hypothetical protein